MFMKDSSICYFIQKVVVLAYLSSSASKANRSKWARKENNLNNSEVNIVLLVDYREYTIRLESQQCIWVVDSVPEE